MGLATVRVRTSSCVRCGGAAGAEVIVGDTVKLWLDQDHNSLFDEWIEATVAIVHENESSSTTTRDYTVEYDTDDLDGAAVALRNCDVISVTCEGCCVIINDYLNLMAGVNLPEVQLIYNYYTNGQILLIANSVVRQIVGNPGENDVVATYIFSDPNGGLIPIDEGAGDFANTRLFTPEDPVDGDWPGGFFSVSIVTGNGLMNQAQVFIPPRARYKTIETAIPAGLTSLAMATVETGESISGVVQLDSAEGFFSFSADPASLVVNCSAAPVADLPIRVTIKRPLTFVV